MNVLRLTKNLSMHSGDPFILFYGKVNDQFCDDDLVLGNIDFMLWRYFKRQGYERIVFFDGASKITFYDDQSRALCLPQASSSRPGHSSLAGPLGSRNLLRSPSATPGEASPPSPALAPGTSSSVSGGTLREQSRMSDLSALEIFDAIIQRTDPAHPTVVIFSVAEDIRNFQQSGFREIQNRMVQWIRSSSPGERKCVFIFQQSTLEEVKSLAQTHELHSVANFVKEKQDDTSNMVGVRFPDEHELANLVHYHRLQNRLSVDWKILARLVQFLAKQRLLMRRWHAMISEIKRLDKDTLLQWNERKAIKSTAHLIQNLEKDANVLDKQSLDKQLSLVQDQEDSIFQLKEALEVWYAQVAKGRPLSFFLAGTSGVGKTYTVKLLAKALEPLGYEYCYFAMTEFMQEHTVANLIGSPRGYVGSEEEPRLFAALNRSPRLIICFDEIEKAHKQILTSLMQLLDEGFLSWNRGEGNFKECLICFTSNAQKEQVVDLKKSFQKRGRSTAGPEFQQAVRDILVRAGVAPEVCGRINKFLVYNPLTPEAVMKITGREIEKLGRSYGLEVVSTAPEFLAAVAARTANSIYGARPVREMVAAELGKTLARFKDEKEAATRQVTISATAGGYTAVPVTATESIPAYEAMVHQSVQIYRQQAAARSFVDAEQLSDRLSAIFCQEDSISQLVEALEVWYAQVAKKNPLSFFLAGTSGVGKTYTVKLLAKALEPLGYEYCYFAMTEFMQEHTVANLIGSPRGYVGSEEEPRLFAALNRSPRLIICFDEIEKAHKQILTSLMQLLDEGFLSWNRGEGNFKECLICFTSNAQKEQVVDLKKSFQKRGRSTAGPEFQQAVRDILVRAGVAPEVCGRINKFLVYNPLTPEAVMKITGREIEKLGRSYGLEVVSTAPEFLAAVAARTANSIYGARPVREEVQAQLGRPLSGLKKRSPAVERVAIQKEGSGYQAIPADEAGNILSYDEMIESARKLIPAGNETASGAGIKLGDRPKRVLHLQEIPTSLPGESEPALPGENSLDQVRPAVGYVEVQEQDGNEGSGSGFVITPDGKFITSYHVVENAVSIRARFDNRPQEWITAELVDGDKEADIALLKLQGGQFPYALIAPYGDRVERGENVGLLGYPLGGDLASTVTYTEGVLSNFKEQSNGVSLLQFDANAYHGNSGGPLFRRRDGQIIGILMGTWKEVDQINFAVSINELYKRLIREY